MTTNRLIAYIKTHQTCQSIRIIDLAKHLNLSRRQAWYEVEKAVKLKLIEKHKGKVWVK